MANSLGNYNETFFAQEALIQLEKQLGMASRVYRDYDPEPRAKGDTIQIRRPSYFTAQDAPATAQDIVTDKLSLTLNKWKEVKIKLTDKELSLDSEKLISDHIRPAAIAIADQIDQDLNTVVKQIPWYTQLSSTFAFSDLTAAKKVMRDNKVPLGDTGNLHLEVDSALESYLINMLGAPSMMPGQQDAAIRQGSIGQVAGFEVFANQNTPAQVGSPTTDLVGAVVGANAIGATSIAVNALAASTTYKAGDTFSIAGDTQRYAIAADFTTDGTGAGTITIGYLGLRKATAGGEVVTIASPGGTVSKTNNLAFHRNFMALAMAPLTELGAELGGARISTIADPKTNLAIRSRMYYVGDTSTVYVALDVLYGFVLLDPNLAVRVYAY